MTCSHLLPERTRIREARNVCRRRRHRRVAHRATPVFEQLENRCVLSGANFLPSLVATIPTDPTVQMSGRIIVAGGCDLYRFNLDADGRFLAQVHSSGFGTLLSLLDDKGNPLIQNEATSPTNPDGQISQHMTAGTYYIAVSGRSGIGAYALTTNFTEAIPPYQALGEGQGAAGVTTADLNGDHNPDLIIPDYYDNQILVNLGLGDGTFQPPVVIPVGTGPTHVVAADFTGDGIIDLAVTDQLSNDVMILLGNGDGTFQTGETISTRAGPISMVAGDFNRDGHVDLAVADQTDDCVEVFKGNGDGSFVQTDNIGALGRPSSLAAADFYADGRLDLAVASKDGGDVIILKGNGDGTFVKHQQLLVGPECSSVIAADFVNDGRPDLVALSPQTGTVLFFRNYGGFFLSPTRLNVGKLPSGLVAADFDGDGRLDMAVTNYGSNNVSLFRGQGDGTFRPSATLSTGSGPMALAAADFNGDGRPSLVISNFIGLTFSVLLNNGDGTFHTPPHTLPSVSPENVATADLNGDGIPDLVTVDLATNDVSVLLGRGDGTFHDPIHVSAGAGAYDIAVGDFNGDHVPDLAVANYFANTVTMLLGNGDGTFRPGQTLATENGPIFCRTADLDGDGHLDLVAADYLSNSLSIYYGRGDGTFTAAAVLPTGAAPSGITFSDFNGDGRTDIAVSAAGPGDVEVLLGTGNRTFAAPLSFAAGDQPWYATAADLNGDGRADLVVADFGASSPSVVSVLLGRGDGTFLPAVAVPVGDYPYPITIGDFNGDGHLDIVTGNDGSNDLSLLLGHGDGTFAPEVRIPAGSTPYGVAAADFNRDGHLDIASANFQSNDLTIVLGRGDGTFEGPETIPLAGSKIPIVTADFNSDGQSDLAVADAASGTVTIRLGQGDGTFLTDLSIELGGHPSGLLVADFNGDGRLDLAISDSQSDKVTVLFGLGDGTFRDPISYVAGKSPDSMAVGDFNGDGKLDLAVADTKSNNVTILYGNGDGTFRVGPSLAVGAEPVALVAADLNGDGRTDLVTADRTSRDLTFLWNEGGGRFLRTIWQGADISPSALIATDLTGGGATDLAIADESNNRILILWGLGGGTFSPAQSLAVGEGPNAMAAVDLDDSGDGSHDLVVANGGSHDLTVFRGWADNSYRHRYTVSVDAPPIGIVASDMNNDSLPDLVITSAATGGAEVYLSLGDGVFSPKESTVPLPHPAPLVLPTGDVLTIDQNGQILLRLARPGSPGEYDSPIVETAGSGYTAADFASLISVRGLVIASIDMHQRLLILAFSKPDGSVDYDFIQLPNIGTYTRVAAGDLNRDGLADLVVLDHASNQVLIFRQDATGHFQPEGGPINVGLGATDITVANVNGDGWPDLVVANGVSGDVSVIPGGPGFHFGPEVRLAAGLSPAGTVLLPDGLVRSSPDEPVGVTAGVFDASGLTDLVVVQRGADRISVLKGTPSGGLADPSLATSYTTGLNPTQAVAARLGRDGRLDLAVLNEGSKDISIFMNNGRGGFITLPRIDAGDDPTGLAVRDVDGDGVADLLVGNDVGDLLVLLGNGDGTFRPYNRADRTVNLAVGDLNGDGNLDFVFSDESQDLLSVQSRGGTTAGFVQGRGNGLLAPGPVAIADMNGDGIPDLIVTNRGGNDVLVYLGLGHSQFAAPRLFYTGTAPVGLTVADVNGDGLPDLVVTNEGSNDVSILLGDRETTVWTLEPGPRLKVGVRPVSTTVVDVNGDGIKDILCVNKDSNSVTLLLGLGGGFFNDRTPRTFAVGQAPIQAFVGRFDASTDPGLVVLNSVSSTMTYYTRLRGDEAPLTILTGGLNPVAGVMGDFNKNGFSDLVIANGGDSLITVFEGSTRGLVLTNSVSLGGSGHLSDLTVVPDKDNGLSLFVSTEGQGRAISVQLALGGFAQATGSVIGNVVPTTSPGFSLGLGLGAVEPLTLVEPAVNGAAARASEAQSQVSVQASTQIGGSAGLSWATVMSVGQAVRPFLTAPFSSVTNLIDMLMQTRQAQTSDILPLGDTDMALVAVILSVTRTSDFATAGGEPSIADEAQSLHLASGRVGDGHESRRESAVDRLLLNPEASLAMMPRDLGERIARSDLFGPDWVWRREATRASRAASALAAGTVDSAPRDLEPVSDVGPNASSDAGLTGPSGTDGGDVAPSQWLQLGQRLILRTMLVAIVVALTAVIVWKGFEHRILGKLRSWTSGRGRPERAPERRGAPGEAMSSGTRARLMRDLPPWLQGPVRERLQRGQSKRNQSIAYSRRNRGTRQSQG
jgi:large repetitive protein